MKIYTKTGDKGETSLLGGGRVTKDCINLQVVGVLDELNAVLGVVVVELTKLPKFIELVEFIKNIQADLFKVGAETASLQSSQSFESLELVKLTQVEVLEKEIDKMCAELPKLNNFILPGGSLAGAYLHLARTVCRRAERELVGLGKQNQVRNELFMYLNRLSDYLFTVARWVNYQIGLSEK